MGDLKIDYSSVYVIGVVWEMQESTKSFDRKVFVEEVT
jgi:hypothetical protein